MELQMGTVGNDVTCLYVDLIVLHKRHEFEWKREECFMVRKPDPPVLVAVTKEPAGRIKTATVQILDYNLNRSVVSPIPS